MKIHTGDEIACFLKNLRHEIKKELHLPYETQCNIFILKYYLFKRMVYSF